MTETTIITSIGRLLTAAPTWWMTNAACRARLRCVHGDFEAGHYDIFSSTNESLSPDSWSTGGDERGC